jgi:hypothetical protein
MLSVRVHLAVPVGLPSNILLSAPGPVYTPLQPASRSPEDMEVKVFSFE